MKKILTLAMLAVMILVLSGFTMEARAADTPAITIPTEADIVQWFPNAARIDGVVTYLLVAKSPAIGPGYRIAKFYNLVSADIQLASIAKGGSYAGGAASIELVDIIKKLGRNPSTMVVTFNPSFGITGGYRTNVGEIKAGFDGGPRVNVLNIDTNKLMKWLGL